MWSDVMEESKVPRDYPTHLVKTDPRVLNAKFIVVFVFPEMLIMKSDFSNSRKILSNQ
jgi:hypothetical protein